MLADSAGALDQRVFNRLPISSVESEPADERLLVSSVGHRRRGRQASAGQRLSACPISSLRRRRAAKCSCVYFGRLSARDARRPDSHRDSITAYPLIVATILTLFEYDCC